MAWTLRVHDTFTGSFNDDINNRTPDTLGSQPWVESNVGDGNLLIGVQNDVDVSGSGECYAYVTAALDDKQASEVVQGPKASSSYGCGCLVRAGVGVDGYLAMFRNTNPWNDAFLYRIDDNSGTQLASLSSAGLTDGATARLEADGSTLTVFLNGVEKMQTSDATYASGYAGMCRILGVGININEFKAYDDAGGGGGLVSRLTLLHVG